MSEYHCHCRVNYCCPMHKDAPMTEQQTAATDNALVEKMSIECTSTHCERRQECASPRDCTGTAKRTRTPCEHCGVSDEQAIRDELHGTVVICDGCKAFVGHFTFDDEGSRP